MAPTSAAVSSPTAPLAVSTTTMAPSRSQAPAGRSWSAAGRRSARATTAGEALHLGLHRVDDLHLQAPVEAVEVVVHQARTTGSRTGRSSLRRKAASARTAGTSRTVCWRPRPAGPRRGLVGLVEGEQGEAEGVLHPRAPEAVELPPEDRQGVGHRLVAVPAQADVQQVQAEGARPLGHVEEDDVPPARRRDEPQGGLGQVAVGVDQHQRRAPRPSGSPGRPIR